MAEIQLDIVANEGEIHSGKAVMVVAPATMGEVGIAPRHAPLLTALKPGEMRVETADGHAGYTQQGTGQHAHAGQGSYAPPPSAARGRAARFDGAPGSMYPG